MKLIDFFIEKHEIISWERITDECNKYKLANLKVDYLALTNIKSKCIIGGGDISINENNAKSISPDIQVIGQNVNVKCFNIIPMPIGLTSTNHDPIIGNHDRIIALNKCSKIYKNLLFLGTRDTTFMSERALVRSIAEQLPFTTSTKYDRTEQGFHNYTDNIYNHKFILCPRGNGIDTHRIWESIYLRSIPIVKKTLAIESFSDLPILFITDWNQIKDRSFLEDSFDCIMQTEYDFKKLNLSYWINTLARI